nr:RNA-directed DNA polymerase, eukaryota, nucleotide-binding alpha-beta plait domain protein [Tanacetum cinerariifolium]
MANFRSKEDNVIRLSKSVFVSNFPDDFGSRDLWNLCQTYGKVSYANVASGLNTSNRFAVLDKPSLVLDDDCGLYMGGLWVLIELENVEMQKEFLQHVGGKSYWVRAKELFTWSSCFLEHKDEGMSDDKEEDNLDFLNDQVEKNQRSEDPFGIYVLLNQPPNTNVEGSTSSRPYPPGYTSVSSHQEEDIEGVHNQNETQFPSSFQAESPKVPHNQNLVNHTDEYSAKGSTSVLSRKNINGGSILDVLEDIIK